jgi:FkbM family methyltransferase
MGKSGNTDDDLRVIVPRGRMFKMVSTPSHTDHYLNNAFEDFTADLLVNLSSRATLFVDIGAHYGFYSLLIGSAHPHTRVIAFEPAPGNFRIFQKALELNNLAHVKALNCAISDREGSRPFMVAAHSSRCGFHPSHLSNIIKTIDVETTVLDRYLEDVPGGLIVIKIDTEGHEYTILEGLASFIENAVTDIRIVMEFHPEMLLKADYSPERLLEKIDQLNFAIHFIDDELRRVYRYHTKSDDWKTFFGKGNYGKDHFNILCTKKANSLNLCFFSHSSFLRGAERSLLELIEELITRYGAICTIVLNTDGPLRKKLDKIGASTLIVDYSWQCDSISLSSGQANSELSKIFAKILPFIKNILGEIDPDIVLTNTIVIPWGAIAAHYLNKPHVWFVREFGEPNHLKFIIPLSRLKRFIKESSSLIVTNSKAVKKSFFGDVPDAHIAIIYPYVYISSDNASDNDEKYYARDNSIKLAIAGTISESKGQYDALLAVRELLKRGIDVEIVIVGMPYPVYLKKLKKFVRKENLSNHVRFLDFKENPYSILQQADIVLLCSRAEAFGRVTVEAMLCRKPVIGTQSGGTPELIADGINGLLYEYGDFMRLADKIEYLGKHPEKRKEFGQAGFDFAEENFTPRKYGGRIYELLHDLLSEKNLSSPLVSQFIGELASYTGRETLLTSVINQVCHHISAPFRWIRRQWRKIGGL